MKVKLTKAQRRLLVFAERAPDRGYDCVIAKGTQRRAFETLRGLGLVESAGYAYDEDGSSDREWPSYRITDAGKMLLAEEAS